METLDFIDEEKSTIWIASTELTSTINLLEEESNKKNKLLRSNCYYHNNQQLELTEEEEGIIRNEVSRLSKEIKTIKKARDSLCQKSQNRGTIKDKLIASISNLRIDQMVPSKFEQAIQLEQQESLKALEKSQEYHEAKIQELTQQKDQKISKLEAKIEQLTRN